MCGRYDACGKTAVPKPLKCVGMRMRAKTETLRRRLRGSNLGLVSAVAIFAHFLVGNHVEAAFLDCANVSYDIDKAICRDAALSELDRSVSNLFMSASNVLTGSRHQALQSSQRDWLRERGKCAESSLTRCLYERYKSRILVLEVQYGQGSSTSPFVYRCDELEREITAAFFKTEPPTVSLSLGDARNDPLMAVLELSGKGEKYVTSDGLVFWATGDDASIALNNGKKTTCHLK
jgi:uncharacterized protein